jgi:tetrahydromethanopterin S-methyltransferase subunit B
MNRFRTIVLGADIVGVLAVAVLFSATPTQAKQCSTERPPNARSYWSYRLIDGRKCWYEGKPMLSKSLLHWPMSRTAQANPRLEPNVLPANHYNLLDAQASIPNDPEANSKPQLKPKLVDASLVPTPKGPLTPNDLRAWANSMAAMSAEPIVTILDRWPEQELPQHRTRRMPAEETSLMNARTIIMVTIMFMALLAVLIEVTFHRRRLADR